MILWIFAHPQSLVFHLPCIKSDHKPILLKTKPDIKVLKDRPFRFLAVWTKHNKFTELVKDKWHFLGNMVESINNFTSHVKDGNRSTYGFLGARKKQFLRSLASI